MLARLAPPVSLAVAFALTAGAQEKPPPQDKPATTLSIPTPGAVANLIQNSTLDAGLEGKPLPKGWYRFGKPVEGYRVEVAGPGRTDEKAVRLAGEGEYGGVTTNTSRLDRTKEYAARAWFKVEGGSDVRAFLKLDFMDDARKWIGSSRSVSIPATKDGWTLVSLIDPVREFPEATQVALAAGINGHGTVWVDDFELTARPAPVENLLPDGGFEFNLGDSPARYTLNQSKGGTVRMLRRTLPVRDGWYALQLVGKGDWAVADGQSIPVEPGKKYVLTGWARARSGKAFVRFTYLGDKGYLGNTMSEPVTSNEWTQVTVNWEPEKYPGITRLTAGAHVSGGEVDAIFDGFVLRAE